MGEARRKRDKIKRDKIKLGIYVKKSKYERFTYLMRKISGYSINMINKFAKNRGLK